MCLILFAYQCHPEFPLIVAANRDEYYQRPTQPPHFWHDHPKIFAGRDMQAGGTWMGINMLGRFAAVTNFREQKAITAQTKSRGELCSQFLNLDASIDQYLKSLDEQRALFAGFNLLLGDFSNSSRPQLAYFSNRQQNPISHLPAGIFGLSNGLLNEAWPKVRTGTQALTQQLYNTPQEIQSVLLDSTPAEFEQLPNTGIEITLEQKLSSRFIKMDGYGTRSATVLRFDKSGNLEWLDQTFGPNSAYTEPQHFNLKLDINRETH